MSRGATSWPPSSRSRTNQPLLRDRVRHSRTRVRPRLDSIDLLRGLVMILMVLTIPATSSRMLTSTRPTCRRPPRRCFSTRWVTHFCARGLLPSFLAGAGAYLTAARGKTRPQLSWFLLSVRAVAHRAGIHRGLVRDHVPLRLALPPGVNALRLGWGMIVLAGLVHSPRRSSRPSPS